MATSRHAIRILLVGTLLLGLLLASRVATSTAAGPALGAARAVKGPNAPAQAVGSAQSLGGGGAVHDERIFSSDFTRGFLDWSLGGMGEATPQVMNGSEGPYCEFSLTGSQGRSELIMGNDLHITEGQTVLYEFEEFIVPGFAYGSKALGWNLFTQFKSDGEGSPMLALDLWNEGGKKGLWVEPEPGPNYFVAPMEEGAWHKISMQITASSSGQGGWVIYLDGQEVDRKTGMDTIRPGKAFAYIKNGLYRSGPTINANSRLRLRDVSLSMVN